MHTLPIILNYKLGEPTSGADLGAFITASIPAILAILLTFLLASRFIMKGLIARAAK